MSQRRRGSEDRPPSHKVRDERVGPSVGTPSPRSMGAWLAKSAAWGLYGLLALACFELFSRIDDRLNEQAPLLEPYSINSLFEEAPHGRQGRPEARFAKWSMNSAGLRGPEPAPDRINILAYGASETFGLFETSGREYPRQLEQLLDRSLPDRFNVLNLGQPGMPIGQIHYLSEAVDRFKPRYVIIYPSPAAYIDIDQALCREPPSPSPPVLSIVDRSRAAGKIHTFLKQSLPPSVSTGLRRLGILWSSRGQPIMQTAPESTLAAITEDLLCAIRVTRRGGAIPVLATHANWFRGKSERESTAMLVAWRAFYPTLSEGGFIDLEERGNAVIREVARDTGTRLVDVATLIPGGDEAFADFVHFTDFGAEAMARAIAPRILELEQGHAPHGDARTDRPEVLTGALAGRG